MRSRTALACVMGDMDMVRPLAMAGIRCLVVTPPGDASRYSRFVRGALNRVESWERAEELVEELVRLGRAQAEPPVLFYEEDRDLLLVSRYRDRLVEAFRFVIPDAELVEDLVDKSRFLALAERLALPVPPSRRLCPDSGCSPSDVDLRFPLILKPMLRPMTRRNQGWMAACGSGGSHFASKARRVETPEELVQLWPRLAEAGVDVLAQELIPGAESSIESYHVYVDAAGEIAGEFTGKKIRTYPADYGVSTSVLITDAADVAALGRDLTRRLALQGVAKLDFKRGPDGRLHLLEVNPRFNLWHHPGAAAGVNLPALVYADLLGLPRPEVRAARAGVRWCWLWHDARAARAQGTALHQWLPWALGCEAKSVLAWDDPLPFLRGVLWRFVRRSPSVSRPRATQRFEDPVASGQG
jgi:D-aspartate ligase